MTSNVLSVGLTIAALLVARLLYRKLVSKHSFPPGPRGIPFFGNIGDIPKKNPSSLYQQWSDIYGSDVIHMDLMGTNVFVLNSLESATDLLDKRSNNYSDRPHLTMINDLVKLGWVLPLAPYGDLWKDTRKAVHHSFNPDAVQRYRDTEVKASRELAQRIASQPSNFPDHIRDFSVRLFMRAMYGIHVNSENDRYAEILAVSLRDALQAGSKPGTFLVDALPLLKYIPEWFPGAYFQRQARAWRNGTRHMQHSFFDDYTQRSLAEDVSDCGIAAAMAHVDETAQDSAYSMSVVKTGLASMTGGGSLTHISALSTFILAMVLHPEVQKKCQAEWDSVVGSARLPDFSDKPSLPYFNATFYELLRWRPIIALALPHVADEDDVYRDWTIPKGSVLIPNVRAMLHDERVWENPSQLNPERFLREGQLDSSKVRDFEGTAFGFGRRVCPGRFMARDSMWIGMVTILASMDIKPSLDKNGSPIMPVADYDEGFVTYPTPFSADIRPRSSEHLTLVQASLDGVEV